MIEVGDSDRAAVARFLYHGFRDVTRNHSAQPQGPETEHVGISRMIHCFAVDTSSRKLPRSQQCKRKGKEKAAGSSIRSQLIMGLALHCF